MYLKRKVISKAVTIIVVDEVDKFVYLGCFQQIWKVPLCMRVWIKVVGYRHILRDNVIARSMAKALG